MIKVEYNRCGYDSYIYFKQSDDLTYLLLYVDDMLSVARNKTHIQKLKAQLKKEFDMKDLGEGKKILGMKITRDRGADFGYPRRTLFSRFGEIQHGRSKTITTSLAGHLKLSSKQCPQSPEEEEKMP